MRQQRREIRAPSPVSLFGALSGLMLTSCPSSRSAETRPRTAWRAAERARAQSCERTGTDGREHHHGRRRALWRHRWRVRPWLPRAGPDELRHAAGAVRAPVDREGHSGLQGSPQGNVSVRMRLGDELRSSDGSGRRTSVGRAGSPKPSFEGHQSAPEGASERPKPPVGFCSSGFCRSRL